MKLSYLFQALALGASLFAGLTSCTKDKHEDTPVDRVLTSFESDLTYEYLEGNFTNPERGSYSGRYFSFVDGKLPELFSVEDLAKPRDNGCSLIHLSVYLCDFLEKPISNEALSLIDKQFENLRQSGCKAILRFAYLWSDQPQNKTNPTLDLILTHIEQLKPLLQKNEDVIYLLQAGFLGAYGEWHSIAHNIDNEGKKQIVLALLDALPVGRQIATRTPSQKRNILGTGIRDTINIKTAFDGSANSRIGGHNDCFLATSNDGGTFGSAHDRRMWQTESQYTAMGGESCYMGSTDCYPCDNAEHMLEIYHYSYLSNVAQVTAVWKEGECNDDLVSRIGHRIALDSAAFRGTFAAGNKFKIQLAVTNHGFASLINERKLEFVLQNADDAKEKYVFISEQDPREWKGGQHYLHEETLTIPEGIKVGQKYNIYLALPDIAPTLHDNPAYSVRLANKGVWDAAQGYNFMASIIAE